MRNYIIRRIAVIPLLVLGVITIVFVLTNLTPSRAIYVRLGLRGTAEEVQALTEEYNLDKPLWYRYLDYLGRIVRGDLGESMAEGHPVIEELALYLPASLELVGVSIVCIIVAGVTLGILSALYKNRWPDVIARGIAVLGNSMPEFWLPEITESRTTAVAPARTWSPWLPVLPVRVRSAMSTPLTPAETTTTVLDELASRMAPAAFGKPCSMMGCVRNRMPPSALRSCVPGQTCTVSPDAAAATAS